MKANPRKILQSLRLNDPLYVKKVKLLAELIETPWCGHMLDDELYKWAKKQGLNVETHSEDKCIWSTCSVR